MDHIHISISKHTTSDNKHPFLLPLHPLHHTPSPLQYRLLLAPGPATA